MKKTQIAVVGFVAIALIAAGVVSVQRFRAKPPIRVGILHSRTGTMAISEVPVIRATLLAIDDLNARGGVMGRPVVPIVVDGRSDWPTFAKQAEHLIRDEKVSVIFGCWTSASRKTVRPVVERFGHLLFYPVQYEGLESSPNIVYTGAAPNQQIIPAVKWTFEHIGRRVFLVGSDYVFPRVANEIIRDHVKALRGEVAGEDYILLGSHDVGAVVRHILESKPDVILNTINGDSNIAFFHALRAAGITPDKIPTVSFSISENELKDMSGVAMAGDYAAWNYFQSVEGPSNGDFVARFQRKYGQGQTTSDPMEAAWFGVHLWAQAVEDAETDAVSEVREAIKRQSCKAPEGVVYIDPENLHTWKTVRIGRINAKGQFDLVWSSGRPVRPVPFPIFRSRKEWLDDLEALRRGWGGNWSSSGSRVSTTLGTPAGARP